MGWVGGKELLDKHPWGHHQNPPNNPSSRLMSAAPVLLSARRGERVPAPRLPYTRIFRHLKLNFFSLKQGKPHGSFVFSAVLQVETPAARPRGGFTLLHATASSSARGLCGEVCPHGGKNDYRQALTGFVSGQCCNKPEDNLLPRDRPSSRRGGTHKLGSHIALFPAGELGTGTVTIEVPPQMCPQLPITTPAGREGEFTALIRPWELLALATDSP